MCIDFIGYYPRAALASDPNGGKCGLGFGGYVARVRVCCPFVRVRCARGRYVARACVSVLPVRAGMLPVRAGI
jgi:hypothetical protein